VIQAAQGPSQERYLPCRKSVGKDWPVKVGKPKKGTLGMWFGLTRKSKFVIQSILGLIVGYVLYDKLGVKMILMARFIPLLRIFAPSVAAMAKMPYRFFLVYNVLGVILWSGVFIWGGFFLGKIPWVQNHFWVLILAVVAIALIPLGKEIVVHFSFAKKLKQKS